MNRRIVNVWKLAGALLFVVGMLACDGSGDAGDDGEARGGFTPYSDDRVAFAVPDHFERTRAGDELISGLAVEYLNDPAGEHPLPEQVHLRYAYPASSTFQIAAWPVMAIGVMTGDDEMIHRDDDVEVAGAREALHVGYRFHADGLDEPYRLVALGAILETADGPVIADLRYVALESEFDEQVAGTILESLRVRG